jgi:hypothetical protein
MRQYKNSFPRLVCCALMLAGMLTPVFTATAQWADMHFPEPDPPAVVQPSVAPPASRMLAAAALSDSEWTFHKTLEPAPGRH